MPLRIPRGFKLNLTTFKEWEAFQASAKASLVEVARRGLAAHVSAAAVKLIDRAHIPDLALALGISGDDRSAMDIVWDNVTERLKRVVEQDVRDAAVDYSLQLAIMSHGGFVYGIPFSAQPAMVIDLLGHPLVSHYGFDECEPRPADIDVEDWELRRRVWRDLLPNPSVTPSTAGQVTRLISIEDFHVKPTPDEVLSSAASRQDRVMDTAYVVATREIEAECKAAEQSDFVGAIIEYGDERALAHKARVASLLPQAISPDLLTAPLSSLVPADTSSPVSTI